MLFLFGASPLPASIIMGVAGAIAVIWSLPKTAAEGQQTRDHREDYIVPSGYERQQCPCCGNPTLNRELDIVACMFCEWDASADPVNQPPLSVARRNARTFLWAHSPDSLPEWSAGAPDDGEVQIKTELQSLYDEIRRAGGQKDWDLWQAAIDVENALRKHQRIRISSFQGEP